MVIYFAQAKLVDANLRRYLNFLLILVCVFWTLGWFRSFLLPIQDPLKPAASLYFLHATFLVASTGMLFLVLASSTAGVFKEKKVFAVESTVTKLHQHPKFSRRAPSLEGLIKLCAWSFELAKIFWWLGCGLALLALAVQMSHDAAGKGMANLEKWLRDPALWAVWFLAIIFLLSDRLLKSNLKIKNLFKSYLVLSCFSLTVALSVMWIESRQSGHIQGEYLR